MSGEALSKSSLSTTMGSDALVMDLHAQEVPPDAARHQRREAFGRLVDQDQIEVDHQRRDRRPALLLFAAGELMSPLSRRCCNRGKIEDTLRRPVQPAVRGRTRHHQVFHHRQRAEHRGPPAPGPRRRAQCAQAQAATMFCPGEGNAATTIGNQSHQRAQQRSLASRCGRRTWHRPRVTLRSTPCSTGWHFHEAASRHVRPATARS